MTYLVVRLFVLVLIACAASLATAELDLNNTSQEDCNSVVSNNDDLNKCNQDLEAKNPCSFTDAEDALVSASVDDKRVLHFAYTSCTARGDGDTGCTTQPDTIVMGQALMVLDDMLIQRQVQEGMGEGDSLCFVYDDEGGKAPTPDCKIQCLAVATEMGKEVTIIETSQVNGLPGYGSFGQNRTVTLLKESERSGGMRVTIGHPNSFLVGVAMALFVSWIW